MLIQADWLEERGDLVGAGVLRGLAEGGTASLHALALRAADVPLKPDSSTQRGEGCGDGFDYEEVDGGEFVDGIDWDSDWFGSSSGWGEGDADDFDKG